MKIIKVLLIILLSFSLGIWSSRVLLKKKDMACATKVEDDCKEDVSCAPKVEEECKEDASCAPKSEDIQKDGDDDHCEEENELALRKKSQELIGLKTMETKLSYFTRKVPVIGQIAQDPESSSYVTVPSSGVLTECKVKIGGTVTKDETICVIKNGDSLIEVKAPASGFVMSNSFKPGDKVDAVSSMHTIADLSNLWATLDVYEKDIALVKLGQKVSVKTIAYPGKTFQGEITFISPRVDEHTYTIKIRALIQNPDNLLKLGMFINADIFVESREEYIVLPQEAVQIIGEKRVVFIKTEEGKFIMRDVKVKDQTKNEIAIYEGLNEGEYVVVEGGFLLKSEFLKSEMGEGCAD